MAIACCGGDLMPFRWASTATHGVQYSATRAAVEDRDHARAWRCAFSKSSFVMRACAYGLRKNATCASRGKRRSSV